MSDVENETQNEVEASAVEENPFASLGYEEKLKFTCAIAKPMASEKLTRRLGKLMKKAKRNKLLSCGVKDAVKQIIKKKLPGILVIAGDVSPIDTVSHIPVICEENNIPYCYVPSRYELGANFSSTASSLCVFIKPHEEYEDLYSKCYSAVDALPLPIN
ncbi:unnamed protein product [Schistocephalus solidus]|uniref:H/ACA ribonucleoprotein complex subunit 2-like protein n=1 Tax=Schistocephalus solidus TaxID=70667 RepID=A0A0X3PKI7_SCHSO|nr:unnamed protein product [Schistocephalus solidus]